MGSHERDARDGRGVGDCHITIKGIATKDATVSEVAIIEELSTRRLRAGSEETANEEPSRRRPRAVNEEAPNEQPSTKGPSTMTPPTKSNK